MLVQCSHEKGSFLFINTLRFIPSKGSWPLVIKKMLTSPCLCSHKIYGMMMKRTTLLFRNTSAISRSVMANLWHVCPRWPCHNSFEDIPAFTNTQQFSKTYPILVWFVEAVGEQGVLLYSLQKLPMLLCSLQSTPKLCEQEVLLCDFWRPQRPWKRIVQCRFKNEGLVQPGATSHRLQGLSAEREQVR